MNVRVPSAHAQWCLRCFVAGFAVVAADADTVGVAEAVAVADAVADSATDAEVAADAVVVAVGVGADSVAIGACIEIDVAGRESP